jgi:AAA15 family ATPase/GTPase
MLIEFSVSNFRSIRERQTLSLVADSGRELRDTHVTVPAAKGTPALLRAAVIYGANAAGKSNLLKALEFFRSLVLDSARESRAGDPLPVQPFLLDDASANAPSRFEVLFVQQGVRYQYGVELDRERVRQEWLVAYPGGRPQRWFERELGQPWHFGPHLKPHKSRRLWADATRDNALFLSTAVQLNAEQLRPVYDWFRQQLRFINEPGAHMSPGYTIHQCGQDADQRARIAAFLQTADLGIDAIEIQRKQVPESALPESMPESLRATLLRDGLPVPRLRHRSVGDRSVDFSLDEESNGTQKLFALAGPLLDVLKNGRVLVVDELDTSLHPALMRHLIGLFHDPAANPHGAQLIFTTHDTSVLDRSLLRRDQVWFVEKDREQQSRLYPLTDFHPRKEESFGRGYLQGRYGAVPFVGEWRL